MNTNGSANGEIVKSLIEIQKSVHSVQKNKKNEFHKYTYADMESYLRELKPLLSEHGIALFTSIDEIDVKQPGHVIVSGTLTAVHTSGQQLSIKAKGEGNDINSKGFGDKATYKAITGLRKYALACLFNIATSDDPEKDDRTPKKNGRAVANMDNASPMQYEEDTSIEDIRQKKFTKDGKQFTSYWITTPNRTYSTLRESIALDAKKFKETGVPVIIGYHPSQKYEGWEILDIARYSPA